MLKKKVGRPSKYNPAISPMVAAALSLAGKTNAEIAPALGVSEKVLQEWLHRFPEFKEALAGGKAFFDDEIELSLRKRARGYEVEETKTTEMFDAGGELINRKVEKNLRHVSPDTGALCFWLKNRRPKQWSERQIQQFENAAGDEIRPIFVYAAPATIEAQVVDDAEYKGYVKQAEQGMDVATTTAGNGP